MCFTPILERLVAFTFIKRKFCINLQEWQVTNLCCNDQALGLSGKIGDDTVSADGAAIAVIQFVFH